MKTDIIRSDADYRDAINYSDHPDLYNFPVTITAKNTKWVLGCGSSDMLSIKAKKGCLYIIAENSGLDYISLTVIDTKVDTIQEVFFGNGELSQNPLSLPKGKQIFDYSTAYQIRILSAYL